MSIDFSPLADSNSEEINQIRTEVRRFAETKFSSDTKIFCRADFDAMAKLGLTGVLNSENIGGSSLGSLTLAGIVFELSRVQLGPAVYLSVHSMVSNLTEKWASSETHFSYARELATGEKLGAFALTEASAGSDARALKTTATLCEDHYMLNGEKIYISSANTADVFLVFARISNEVAAFIVETSSAGLSIGANEKTMGCEGSSIASLHFQDCRVPKENLLSAQGYKVALSGLAGGRINIAASACGISTHALELASSYAREREQFGKPIAEFQGVQFMLADMASKTAAAGLMTKRAAELLDSGDKSNLWPSMAKCFATDTAMEVTTDAVQVFGGAGYLSEFGVEQLMRDAKMLQIVEGTNQIQRMVIGREITKAPC